jgi:hypothetical protein
MEAMRESWTDGRLDDLNGKVDALRVEMRTEFVHLDDRFDALQRTLLQIAGGTIATLIAGFASIIATQL